MACSSVNDAADERNDPGAAPYGNFINYYSFNPPENRLSLIPASLLHDLDYRDEHQTTLILDVGCNSGVRGGAHSRHFTINRKKLLRVNDTADTQIMMSSRYGRTQPDTSKLVYNDYYISTSVILLHAYIND